MGNQQIAQQKSRYASSRHKTLDPREEKNNYSIQINSKKYGNQRSGNSNVNNSRSINQSIDVMDLPPSSNRSRKKSFDVGNQEQSFLKLIDQSRDNKRKQSFQNRLSVNVNDVTSRHEVKQNDRTLQKLSQKNQQLRKQLKAINQELTQKLKKKKFVPKKKQALQQDSDKQQEEKQKILNSAGIKRQLQNGYKQIDMYKRTIKQLKNRQQTEVSNVKIKNMENQIADLDRIINECIKKIDGMKNVKKMQDKGLQNDLNQDLIDGCEILKKEQQEIKNKIKECAKRQRQRQNNYKKQQAYLFEVQKKLREMNGDYFPQLKKKTPVNNPNNKQPKQDKNTQNRDSQAYPPVFQIKTVQDQLNDFKNKHENYHVKINNMLQLKNKSNDQSIGLDQQIKIKDKIIQTLRIKIQQIKKIMKPGKNNLFGYDNYEGSELQSEYGGGLSQIQKQVEQQVVQDQFDIKHLIANIPKPIRLKPVEMQKNNSIKSGQTGQTNQNSPKQNKPGMLVSGQKSQPKKWGNILTRRQQKGKSFKNQLVFDDSVQFQADITPLIIGVSVWVNKNTQVLAIQAIYMNKDQVRYGVKSSSSADGFIVRYDLQAPDYVKNITGAFGQNGLLEYIAFYSKKGKTGVFGNKGQNQQSFTFGMSSNQRPFRLNGSSIIVDSEPRICKIGIQICPQE